MRNQHSTTAIRCIVMQLFENNYSHRCCYCCCRHRCVVNVCTVDVIVTANRCIVMPLFKYNYCNRCWYVTIIKNIVMKLIKIKKKLSLLLLMRRRLQHQLTNYFMYVCWALLHDPNLISLNLKPKPFNDVKLSKP